MRDHIVLKTAVISRRSNRIIHGYQIISYRALVMGREEKGKKAVQHVCEVVKSNRNKKRGQSFWWSVGLTEGTLPLHKTLQTDSVWGYPISHARTLHPTMPQSDHSPMYIVALSRMSSKQAATSDRSHSARWSQPWAHSRRPHCPWYRSRQSLDPTEQYIIFLTRTIPPPLPRRLTHTSIVMSSPAHGERSQQWHYSSPASPQGRKPPSAMWQRHTEPSLSSQLNGQGSSFDCRQKTNLQSTPAITLASHRQEECMGYWQMRGQTSSKEKGWAPSISGSTTTSFFEYPALICLVTTCSGKNGTAKYKSKVAAGRRAATCGMGGRRCQTVPWRSLMRIAASPSRTSLTLPHIPRKIAPSHMQTLTLMNSPCAWASDGSPQRRFPSAWKSRIWDSCYVWAEHSTRLEWEGYDQVTLRVVHEASA